MFLSGVLSIPHNREFAASKFIYFYIVYLPEQFFNVCHTHTKLINHATLHERNRNGRRGGSEKFAQITMKVHKYLNGRQKSGAFFLVNAPQCGAPATVNSELYKR